VSKLDSITSTCNWRRTRSTPNAGK